MCYINRFIFALMCLFAQVATAQDFNLSWIDQDARSRSSRVKAFGVQKETNMISAPSGMDIRFHRISLNIDPAVRFISGSVSTSFVPKEDNRQVISFDMHDSLHVTGIQYHGAMLTSYTHQHNKLVIQLPTRPATPLFVIPAKVGTPFLSAKSSEMPTLPDSILISYSGTPFDDGAGSFLLSSHHGVPILYTQSEPYGAKDWWPCSQDLNDKIDSVLLVISVPPGNRAAANGMLISEQHLGDCSIYQWMHKHPIAAYLIGIAVTNYAVYSDYVLLDDGGHIEILNYVYPETLADVQSQTRQIIKPFQLFNRLFGLYPFADERYGHAQWNIGGGMEHQTMSFMGSFGYDLMAHELGHQWFGDFITCGSWKDIWLNEGFATYMTGLCYELDQGGIYWEPFKRLSINRVIKEPGGSVYCYDTTDIDRLFDARLSYSKGAMVLHMLRWEMGDDDFFRAMNNYLYDPKLANGYARTEDLIRHAEAVADTSFVEFFNDWVYGGGYPKYEIIYRLNPDNEVELEISQEQSDSSVSFFEMDLPVRLYGRSGGAKAPPLQGRAMPSHNNAARDGVPASAGMTTLTNGTGVDSITVVLHHTHDWQIFKVRAPFAVDSLKLDPDRWICTADPLLLNVSEIPYDQHIKIFPNPVTDLLTIQMALPGEVLNIRIYNQQGQLVQTEKTSSGSGLVKISMHSLPAGVYLVSVGGKMVGKIVKRDA